MKNEKTFILFLNIINEKLSNIKPLIFEIVSLIDNRTNTQKATQPLIKNK
jgi:hypothetical protein